MDDDKTASTWSIPDIRLTDIPSIQENGIKKS